MEDKERRTRLVGKRPNRSCLSYFRSVGYVEGVGKSNIKKLEAMMVEGKRWKGSDVGLRELYEECSL